jgi:hypothetical protein
MLKLQYYRHIPTRYSLYLLYIVHIRAYWTIDAVSIIEVIDI